ncbi:hypothetical protein Acid345_3388 [Candidatus Koribacter versatilis Ellin345]|uniref:ORC1/DEAH AAA+ ATPase domain-containing protein n=1 Tax=Koribacter versatilis (strain Ellin345) TaxID=204669 RepID=Q1IL61_KORVE|nr:ATP-binding protein [Candidatus Koribacter versatilis]ABF42389.1 hypothetical protein Acid345_3388 [Candidatus Koribacter versatilis Ellin345]
MALSMKDRELLLATSLPAANAVREQLNEYLARTGLAYSDFARRINYSSVTLRFFIKGRYANIASNDAPLRKAITEFIAAHPIEPVTQAGDKLYETENVQLLRQYFYEALDDCRMIYVHGAPGSQKTFVLEHLTAELNCAEVSKNGHGRRAYYVYCPQSVKTSQKIMREIAEACGVDTTGDAQRILKRLRFEFRTRKVIFILDEAQHLNYECLETIRGLFDRMPHCAILLAGSHQLETTFMRDAARLEQWNSRLHFGKALPGISDDEADTIIRQELGEKVTSPIVRKLITESKALDVRRSGEHNYISARRLFWSIRDIKRAIEKRQAKKEASA